MIDQPILDALFSHAMDAIKARDTQSFFNAETTRINKTESPPFAFRDISDSVVACVGDEIEWARGGGTLAIGFPFPLYTREIPAGVFNSSGNVSIGVAVHMTALQEALRNSFLARMALTGPVQRITFDEFAELAGAYLRRDNDSCTYCDPFRFAGDSIAYAWAFRTILNHISSGHNNVISSNRAMIGVGNFHYIDDLSDYFVTSGRRSMAAQYRELIILPNFIDDQWPVINTAVQTLVALGRSTLIIIPGRNLLIDIATAGTQTFHIRDRCDPTLWVEPREVVLDDALDPFEFRLELDRQQKRLPTFVGRTIFLHPCTSIARKDLSVQLMGATANALHKGLGNTAQIEVGTGDSRIPRHREWHDSLASFESGATHWSFADDNTLTDLERRVRRADAVISADTAVAHLAYIYDKVTVCIYNRQAWDSRCVGSMFHHSGFGFGYCWPGFFVCLAGEPIGTTDHDIANSIVLLLQLLGRTTRFSWKTAAVIARAAEEMQHIIRKAGTPKSTATHIRNLLTGVKEELPHAAAPIKTLLLYWLCYHDIEAAVDSPENQATSVNHLLSQFVRLHPITKLHALISSGMITAAEQGL